MDVEHIVEKLGDFGSYQKRLCLFVALVLGIGFLNLYAFVIILATPAFQCDQSEWANQSGDALNYVHGTVSHNKSAQLRDVDMSISTEYSETGISPNNTGICSLTLSNGTTRRCNRWIYDKTDFDLTVITEFDWVCERRAYRSHVVMVYMIGMSIGSLAGSIGDIIGRKLTVFICLALQGMAGLAVLLSTEFYSFVTTEFIYAVISMPLNTAAVSLGVELLAIRRRFVLSTLTGIVSALGFMIFVGLSYVIRNWRYMQLVIALPNFVYLVWWWFIVESPRWLMTRDRNQEAKISLKYVARVNGVELPESLLVVVDEDKTNDVKPTTERVWKICKSPLLLLRTLIVCCTWFVSCVTYYGLSLNVGNLHGNIFVNCLISAAVEIPGMFLIILLVNRIGRKPLYCGGLLISGVLCLASVLPILLTTSGLAEVTVTLAMLGKMGACLSFGLCYLYPLELYPTTVRSAMMGIFSTGARLGSVVSPYIANLGDFIGGRTGEVTPFVFFGGLGLLCSLLILFLPETNKRPLPETIEQSIHYGRSRNYQESIIS